MTTPHLHPRALPRNVVAVSPAEVEVRRWRLMVLALVQWAGPRVKREPPVLRRARRMLAGLSVLALLLAACATGPKPPGYVQCNYCVPCLREPPPSVRSFHPSAGKPPCEWCLTTQSIVELNSILVGYRQWSDDAWAKCGPKGATP